MNHRVFSRFRRGLGLFDTILAFTVLSVTLLWGSQLLENWITRQAIANDARVVEELARTGRLLLEGNITHQVYDTTTNPVSSAPLAITFSDLENAGLRSPGLGTRSPAGRTLTLYAYRESDEVMLLMARARGISEVGIFPDASDGVSSVGVLLSDEDDTGTEHILNGPGVNYDMYAINQLSSRFATREDIFALDYVPINIFCHSYVYRIPISGCTANMMSTSLNMNEHDLLNVKGLNTTGADIRNLEGPLEIIGNLTVHNDLIVKGDTVLTGDLSVPGTLTAANITVDDDLEVQGDLTATGNVTGADLTFSGEATIAGTARMGSLEISDLTTTEMKAERIDIGTGTFTNILGNNVTVTTCTGCN